MLAPRPAQMLPFDWRIWLPCIMAHRNGQILERAVVPQHDAAASEGRAQRLDPPLSAGKHVIRTASCGLQCIWAASNTQEAAAFTWVESQPVWEGGAGPVSLTVTPLQVKMP